MQILRHLYTYICTHISCIFDIIPVLKNDPVSLPQMVLPNTYVNIFGTLMPKKTQNNITKKNNLLVY